MRTSCLLGMWNHRVPARIADAARALKHRGLVRHIAVSTHNRALFVQFGAEFDIFHVRYNAAHRGAEKEVFPYVAQDSRAGLVSFTATSWGQLLRSRRIPSGERVPTAGDCSALCCPTPPWMCA